MGPKKRALGLGGKFLSIGDRQANVRRSSPVSLQVTIVAHGERDLKGRPDSKPFPYLIESKCLENPYLS